MKTWRVELTAGEKSLAGAKIQRGIFQGDALSPLLFIIAMMPLDHILRKCTPGYKLSKSQEQINQLMYIDDIKLLAKNEKELETNTRNTNIQSGHRDGIWQRKMRHASNENGKRYLADGLELPNQDKITTLGEKGTYKYLGILEPITIKQVEMKEKNEKEYLRRAKKLLRTKLYSRNLIKRINIWAVLLERYSGPFLKWTREEFKKMDQRTKI